MIFHRSRLPLRREMAVDLGTAFIRIAMDENDVVTIPTVWATKSPFPNRIVACPKMVIDVLRPFLGRAKRLGFLTPRVFVGVPTDATVSEESKLISNTLCIAGAASAILVPRPFASAIGAGLDVSSPYAQMILDAGEGIIDGVIIRAGEIVAFQTDRIGHDNLRADVQKRTFHCWGRCLTREEPDQIIPTIGFWSGSPGKREVKHKFPLMFRSFSVNEFPSIIEPLVQEIIGTATDLLKNLSPELGCEIIENGIILTGGDASLPGLKEQLAEVTLIKVLSPDNPHEVVIDGLRKILM